MNELMNIKERLEQKYELTFEVNEAFVQVCAYLEKGRRRIKIEKGFVIDHEDESKWNECFYFADDYLNASGYCESGCSFACHTFDEIDKYLERQKIEKRKVVQLKLL